MDNILFVLRILSLVVVLLIAILIIRYGFIIKKRGYTIGRGVDIKVYEKDHPHFFKFYLCLLFTIVILMIIGGFVSYFLL